MVPQPSRPDAPPQRAPAITAETQDVMSMSPRWGPFTKFLIALVFVVLLGALLLRFQQMIVPLVLAVVLTYLLRPVATALATRTGLAWRAAVAVVYLVLLVTLLGLLTLSGIALIQQIQSLYTAVVDIAADLPTNVQRIISAPFTLGPFRFDLSRPFFIGPFRVDLTTTDLSPLYQQVLGALQGFVPDQQGG